MPGYNRVIQLVIQGELHGSQTNNVWHFGNSNTALAYDGLVSDVTALIDGALKTATSSEQKYQSIIIRQLAPTLLDAETFILSPEREGTPFAPALPSFNAALTSIKTGLGGRSHRGRIFFPGVIEADVQQSIFTTGGIAKWQSVADYIKAHFMPVGDPPVVPDWQFGILSRKIAGTPPNYVNGFFAATNLVPRIVVASMHSRKKGVGV